MRWRWALAAFLVLGSAPAAWAIEGVTPDAKYNPAEGEGSPAFRESVRERDRQRLRDARQEGGSHIDVTPGVVTDSGQTVVDPVEVRSRQPEPEDEDGEGPVRVQRVEPQAEWPREEEPTYRESQGGDEGNLDAIVAALIEAINRPPDVRVISFGSVGDGAREEARRPVAETRPALPRVGAGDAFYARMLHAVNSDYPGPVLIELLQPPLAGAVARGEFQLVRERLVIRLSSLDVAGEAVPVDAVAVGLDCACFGVAGEVSYHWWDRVILPAATGFVERYLIARAEPDRRVVTGEGGVVVTDESERSARQARDAGLAAAAGRVGQVLLEQAPSRQTVSIPENAEVAVMFAERLARREAPASVEAAAPAPAPPRVERVRQTSGANGGDGR